MPCCWSVPGWIGMSFWSTSSRRWDGSGTLTVSGPVMFVPSGTGIGWSGGPAHPGPRTVTTPDGNETLPDVRALRRFVTRWELVWHGFTISFFAVALGLVIVLFPDVSNLWVSVFVLIGSFTAAVAAMISSIKTRGEPPSD